MILFKFETSDIPEESKRFYHDVAIRFAGGEGDLIEEILEKFEYFLRALGYSEKSIEKITTEE